MNHRSERHFSIDACSGPCEQGNKACATPEACQIAELPFSTWRPVFLALAAFWCGVAWIIWSVA